MSYCPKCGTHENEKFKCSHCGSPLVYAPSDKGPTFFDKILRYKSFAFLLIFALLISFVSFAAKMLGYLFWAAAIAVIIGVAVLYFKNKNSATSYDPRSNSGQNQYGNQNRYGSGQDKVNRKPANVIPFKRRKRSDKDNKNNGNS